MSEGRSGSTGGIPHKELRASDIVNFDCMPVYGHYASSIPEDIEIVFVIWEDDWERAGDKFESMGLGSKVIVIRDTTRPVEARSGPIPLNNQNRQFFSTLEGVKELARRGCTHAIKVRSDQVVDVEQLRDDYMAACLRIRRPIMVAELLQRSLDWLPDFYFVAEVTLFERLCQNFLQSSVRNDSVHKHLFQTWLAVVLGGLSWLSRFENRAIRRFLAVRAWLSFTPSSKRVLENLAWRGEPLDKTLLSGRVFLDDFLAAGKLRRAAKLWAWSRRI